MATDDEHEPLVLRDLWNQTKELWGHTQGSIVAIDASLRAELAILRSEIALVRADVAHLAATTAAGFDEVKQELAERDARLGSLALEMIDQRTQMRLGFQSLDEELADLKAHSPQR